MIQYPSDQALTIRCGSFRAVVRLDELPRAGIRRTKKILKLLFCNPMENQGAIAAAVQWSTAQVTAAKSAQEEAQRAYKQDPESGLLKRNLKNAQKDYTFARNVQEFINKERML